MYPFPVVLVGSPDGLTDLDTILGGGAARLDARYADLRAVRAGRPAGARAAVYLVRLGSEPDLAHLRLLADAYPGNPIVGLVEGACSVDALFRISRAGAAQIVPLPWPPGDLAAALDRVARQFGRTPPLGRVVAVCGVVGGCGATSLALSLGFEAAGRWGRACVVAEPAVPFGRLAPYLDLRKPRPTAELYSTPEAPDLNAVQAALTPVSDRLRVLAAPAPTFPAHNPSGDSVEHIIDSARRVADVVLVDLPYTFDDTCFRVLGRSDEVVLVSDSSVPGLEALRLVRDAVAARRGAGRFGWS